MLAGTKGSQPLNAPLPIAGTPSSIVRVVRPSQIQKASFPTQAAVEIISAAVPAHRFHDEQDSAGGLIIGIAHGKVGGFEYIITFFKTRSLQNNIKPFRSAGILKLPLHAVVVAVHDGFV